MTITLTNGTNIDTTKEIKTPKGSKGHLTGSRVYHSQKGYIYEVKIKTGFVNLLESQIQQN